MYQIGEYYCELKHVYRPLTRTRVKLFDVLVSLQFTPNVYIASKLEYTNLQRTQKVYSMNQKAVDSRSDLIQVAFVPSPAYAPDPKKYGTYWVRL